MLSGPLNNPRTRGLFEHVCPEIFGLPSKVYGVEKGLLITNQWPNLGLILAITHDFSYIKVSHPPLVFSIVIFHVGREIDGLNDEYFAMQIIP